MQCSSILPVHNVGFLLDQSGVLHLRLCKFLAPQKGRSYGSLCPLLSCELRSFLVCTGSDLDSSFDSRV